MGLNRGQLAGNWHLWATAGNWFGVFDRPGLWSFCSVAQGYRQPTRGYLVPCSALQTRFPGGLWRSPWRDSSRERPIYRGGCPARPGGSRRAEAVLEIGLALPEGGRIVAAS